MFKGAIMKKQILTSISALILASSLNANDMLTGDARLACEAILCLSSGTRPSECSPSINKYFSIKHRKWSDTVNARRNFLKLCPVDGADEKDPVFADLRDNVLPNVDARKCTAEYINRNPDKRCVKERCGERRCSCIEYEYRPATKMPTGCQALITHSYTNIRPVNTCKTTRWYSANEWSKGEVKIKITKDEYLNLKRAGATNLLVMHNNARICKNNSNFSFCSPYYKVEKIKNCWVNND